MLNAIVLALRLASAVNPATPAQEACAVAWEADSDGYHSCVDGLRAWAIESRDRADGSWLPTLADVRWPDPTWAGEQEWAID
jgi:hypothetical protein